MFWKWQNSAYLMRKYLIFIYKTEKKCNSKASIYFYIQLVKSLTFSAATELVHWSLILVNKTQYQSKLPVWCCCDAVCVCGGWDHRSQFTSLSFQIHLSTFLSSLCSIPPPVQPIACWGVWSCDRQPPIALHQAPAKRGDVSPVLLLLLLSVSQTVCLDVKNLSNKLRHVYSSSSRGDQSL